jgi:hypothetical protein
MAKVSNDKHLVSYELFTGGGWKPQTISVAGRVKISDVLKEMRAQQDIMRNITLVQSAA